MSNYKLSTEVIQFILNEKRNKPELSCRNIVPLVEQTFNIKLSKSSINSVIKDAHLSNAVGRLRIRRPTINLIENGGFIFLHAADIKLSLLSNIEDKLEAYFSDIDLKTQQKINEILTYISLIKFSQPSIPKLNYKKLGLWWLTDGIVSQRNLLKFRYQLNQVAMVSGNEKLKEIAVRYNFNDIKDLHRECLMRLNSYVQTNFFPSGYQFLDLIAMKERFYCLPAHIESKPHSFVKIQLFYPPNFIWANDLIWQEGFSYAANRINTAKICTEKKEQILINPSLKSLRENAFFPY